MYTLRMVISDSQLSDGVLSALLESLITIDVEYLHRRMVGSDPVPPLFMSGVRYAVDNRWLDVGACRKQGKADCKSLVAWRVAELRLAGEHASPRVIRQRERKDGRAMWHVLVRRGNGTLEDPSRILGMTVG